MPKVKKIILILVTVSVLVVSFVMPSSALSVDFEYNGYEIYNIDLAVYNATTGQNVNTFIEYISDHNSVEDGLLLNVNIDLAPNMSLKDRYIFTVHMSVPQNLSNKGYYTIGSYNILVPSVLFKYDDNYNSIGHRTNYEDGNSYSQSVKPTKISKIVKSNEVGEGFSLDCIGYNFDYANNGDLDAYYVNYQSTFSFMPKSLGLIDFALYLGDFDFETLTPEQYAEFSSQDREKEEANKDGNTSVNGLQSALPNYSSGFIDSITSFVQNFSYTGTECSWVLPSIKLPSIDGVMDEVTLTDSMEIPFNYWIEQIPTPIMTLIQSLLTIALIVYCFKELYSVVSYVLTLRGGSGE